MDRDLSIDPLHVANIIKFEYNNALMGSLQQVSITQSAQIRLIRTSQRMAHVSSLEDPYFDLVRDGTKIYELRVNDKKRQQMKVGDLWTFTHKQNDDKKEQTQIDDIQTQIVEIVCYASFKDAIMDTGVENLLPQDPNISCEEAISIYEQLDDGNYKTNAKIFGVVRFKLQI